MKESSDQLQNLIVSEPITVLGIAVGEDRWLVHVNDVGEVLSIPKVVPVSLTQSWFQGVANIHGNLYGIVDLSLYLSGIPTPRSLKNRLLLASQRFGINSGLLVNNMLGIRSLSDFMRDEITNQEDETVACFRDKEGKLWYELNMGKLVNDQKFLQIAV